MQPLTSYWLTTKSRKHWKVSLESKNKNINNIQRHQQLHITGLIDLVDLVQVKLVKTNQTNQTRKNKSAMIPTGKTQNPDLLHILSKMLSIQENIMQSHTEKQESVTHTRGKKTA